VRILIGLHELLGRVEECHQANAGDDGAGFVQLPAAAPVEPAKGEDRDGQARQDHQFVCPRTQELPGRAGASADERAQNLGDAAARDISKQDRNQIDPGHGTCQATCYPDVSGLICRASTWPFWPGIGRW